MGGERTTQQLQRAPPRVATCVFAYGQPYLRLHPSGVIRLVAQLSCPYVHRCRALLEDRRVPHTVEHIDLRQKPTWFSALSTSGRVPMLLDGDVVVEDSTKIMRYLDARWGPRELNTEEDHARLQRDMTPVEDAITALWRLQSSPSPEETRARVQALESVTARLRCHDRGAPASADVSLTLLDCTAVPMLYRLQWLRSLPAFSEFRVPAGVDAWADRVLSSRAAQHSTPPSLRAYVLDALARVPSQEPQGDHVVARVTYERAPAQRV